MAFFHLVESSCKPHFQDRGGSTCEVYEEKFFCTSDGDYGRGWPRLDGQVIPFMGEFWTEWRSNDTAWLCPQCGCKGKNHFSISSLSLYLSGHNHAYTSLLLH